MTPETFSERQIIAKFAAGERLPRHFRVACETPMAAHVMEAMLASSPQDHTVIVESKDPLSLECFGRCMSVPDKYRTIDDNGHLV